MHCRAGFCRSKATSGPLWSPALYDPGSFLYNLSWTYFSEPEENKGKWGEKHSVAVGCSSWQGVGWGGGRETQECLIFAGRWERCYLGGGFQQRPKHLSSWQPSQRGVGVRVEVVKGEANAGSDGWVVVMRGPCCWGSHPKSRLA